MAAKKKVTRKKTARKKITKKKAAVKKKASKKKAKLTTNKVTRIIPDELKFHYLKAKHYRSVHADGFFGGVTGRKYIHMTIFSERNPIPREVFYPVIGEFGGGLLLGDEDKDKRVGRDGVIRELEVGVFFDLESAKKLKIWLDEKITQVEQINMIEPGDDSS